MSKTSLGVLPCNLSYSEDWGRGITSSRQACTINKFNTSVDNLVVHHQSNDDDDNNNTDNNNKQRRLSLEISVTALSEHARPRVQSSILNTEGKTFLWFLSTARLTSKCRHLAFFLHFMICVFQVGKFIWESFLKYIEYLFNLFFEELKRKTLHDYMTGKPFAKPVR